MRRTSRDAEAGPLEQQYDPRYMAAASRPPMSIISAQEEP
jgi:hypothetical protein